MFIGAIFTEHIIFIFLFGLILYFIKRIRVESPLSLFVLIKLAQELMEIAPWQLLTFFIYL